VRNSDRLQRLQGAYYLATGVWPLLSRRSFEAVTGPKHDFWLAKTVGAITTAVGASLIVGARPEPSAETRVLAIGTASAFAAIDVVYGLKRRISAVYLLDAGLQGAIIVAHVRRMINRNAVVGPRRLQEIPDTSLARLMRSTVGICSTRSEQCPGGP
jgi:hypothetical protein